MARNNVRLINYHTSGTTAPQRTDMAVGEIAVGKDLIWSKHKENEELSVFISSGAVHSAISAATTNIKGITDGLSTDIATNTKKFKDYATSADTVAADEKVLSSAKAYTDLLKAKTGETYNGETLAGLKSEINSLKDGSDTTVGGLATRVTTAERKITALETTVGDNEKGLVKNVADLTAKFNKYATSADTVAADTKTLNDAKSYTDGEINKIKGGETTETISSLKGKIETNSSDISGITNGKKLNNFKAVEDEINLKISSVYKVKGSCTYEELLSKSEPAEGDVWNVTNAHDNVPAGTNYVWAKGEGETTAKWDALGGTVDLSTYATKTYVDDALTGVTGADANSIVTRLGTAETDIAKLKNSASTLDTDVKTIKGWKINDKFISGSPILNGTDIKVDDKEDAKTLTVAIAAAKTAGDNAMTYATGVSGSVKTLTDTVNSNKNAIDAYTVNGTKISENPVLTGENVKVSSGDTAQSLNKAIADAKAAGTAASSAVDTLRGGYNGTIKDINDSVTANTSDITKLKNDVTDISPKANSAVQTITVTHTETNKITATKAEGSTEVVLNFDNMVIDCGEF